MSLQVTGKIHVINEAQQVTERFRKREFVLRDGAARYEQFVLFQLTGDRCDELDSFSVGDDVRVEFKLRGREWTSPSGEVRYFNSLDVWDMVALDKQVNEPTPQAAQPVPDDNVPF